MDNLVGWSLVLNLTHLDVFLWGSLKIILNAMNRKLVDNITKYIHQQQILTNI